MARSPQALRSRLSAFTAATVAFFMIGGITTVLAGPAIAAGDDNSTESIKPIILYDFDHDTGTEVTDSSGNGYDGTWVNGVAGGGVEATYASGVSGQAAHVSGNKNVIQLPQIAGVTDGSGSFSVEFWYFQFSASGDAAVFASANTASCNNPGFSFYNSSATNSKLKACWGLKPGGSKQYLSATGPTNGAWHHIAAVIDRTEGRISTYEDGNLTDSSTAIDSGTVLGKYAFTLGSEASLTDTSDGSVDGLFDNFKFFDVPISSAQVLADFEDEQPRGAHYSVSFDGNGADGGQMAEQQIPVGVGEGLHTNSFTRSGYQFGGWAESAHGRLAFSDGAFVSDLAGTDETVTLYAVWNKYRAEGDTAAPIISYNFDNDEAATVKDESGSSLDASWTGTAAYGSGIEGKAAFVNSPDGATKGTNFFSLPLVDSRTDASGSFSYVFWMKQTKAASFAPIVSNQDFAHCYNRGTTFYNTPADPGILRACFGQDGNSTTQHYLPDATTKSVLDSWHHVAVIADREHEKMSVYIDGKLTVENSDLKESFNLVSGYPFRVGAEGSGKDSSDGYVNAYIDDFDFYDVAIDGDQVRRDYDATKPIPPIAGDGSTLPKGFITDTFRAADTSVGDHIAQPVSGLWNGGPITDFTKIGGDEWLSIDENGTILGQVPEQLPDHPGYIKVEATDGETTSTLSVQIPLLGPEDAPQLAAVTWDLWDGGTKVDDAFLKNLKVIASNGFDLVGVQHDGADMATQLASALGWYSSQGPDGTALISAYPLSLAPLSRASQELPVVAGTATIAGQDVDLWSIGLDRKDYGPYQACFAAPQDASTLVASEKQTTRYQQAGAIAATISDSLEASGTRPVIVFGGLESPAASDWTSETEADHCDFGAVSWPVPGLFDDLGLIDSFRELHPDPAADPGSTWSPVVTTNKDHDRPEPQDRIDYVFVGGEGLTPLASNTFVAGWPSATAIRSNSWASDHRAVVTTLSLTSPESSGGGADSDVDSDADADTSTGADSSSDADVNTEADNDDSTEGSASSSHAAQAGDESEASAQSATEGSSSTGNASSQAASAGADSGSAAAEATSAGRDNGSAATDETSPGTDGSSAAAEGNDATSPNGQATGGTKDDPASSPARASAQASSTSTGSSAGEPATEGEALPNTGSDVMPAAAAAFIALLTGIGALVSRRRHTSESAR